MQIIYLIQCSILKHTPAPSLCKSTARLNNPGGFFWTMNTEKIMLLHADYEQRFNFKMTNLLYTFIIYIFLSQIM